MTMALEIFFLKQIEAAGPMDISRFMRYALCHPQYGYYMNRDPFGVRGDFTTAPEISQMFGELIGVWVADVWMQMDQPGSFVLLECGPGRGTLMADVMRATSKLKGFHKAAQIHLLETSPALKAMQKDKLSGYNPIWHDTPETLPTNIPLVMLANEFLDALPVRQIEKTSSGWAERVIIANDNALDFGLIPVPAQITPMIPASLQNKNPGFIYEFSPARSAFVSNICDMLKTQSGAALIIDYGAAEMQPGGTLSAIYKHDHVSPLEHIGECDLSAHVDFTAICETARAQGVQCFGPVEQGAFLNALGIEQRAEALRNSAEDNQAQDIQKALHRLTASDQMGSLFKVIGLGSKLIAPMGFAQANF